MKQMKTILALGLTAAFFAGCAKTDNTSTTNTTTSAGNTSSAKSTSSPSSGMPSNTNMTMPSNPSSSPSTSGDTATSTSSSGQGETFTNQEAGVKFTLPAEWTTKNEGESIIAASPHDAVNVVFWVPKGDDFQTATNQLSEQLDKVIKNSKTTSPGHETTHNGMQAYTAAGTGEVDGKEIAWEVDVLKAKKPFFVLSFAAPEMFKQHQAEYQQLLSSLKPIE